MKNQTDLRRGRHCVTQLHAHLVFVTKYRRHVFNDDILQRIHHIFETICQGFEVTCRAFNGEADHIHLRIEYPPKVQLSKRVNALKGSSSRYLRREFPLIKQYLWKGALWSPSYFACSCGGASIDVLKKYIQQQSRPD